MVTKNSSMLKKGDYVSVVFYALTDADTSVYEGKVIAVSENGFKFRTGDGDVYLSWNTNGVVRIED